MLADFTPERYAVQYKGSLLVSIRGLSLEDVSVLIRAHLTDLQRLYELVQGGTDSIVDRLSVDGFLLKLITDLPVLASNVIALASDEPTAADKARMLPLPLQLKVLQEIMRLTCEDVGGPKAFVALVREMIGKQLPVLQTTLTP